MTSEKGSVMVYTLLTITLLAIASMVTHLSLSNQLRSTQTRLNALQAMYAAESGLLTTLYLLNTDANLVSERIYPDDEPSFDSADPLPISALYPGDMLSYRTWFDGSAVIAEGLSQGLSQRIKVVLNRYLSS